MGCFCFRVFWYTLCDISIPIGFLNPARCVKQVATPARVRQRHAAVDAGPAITDLDLEKTRNLDQWRKERTERKPGSLWSNDVAFFVLVASVMAMAILIWYWSVRFWPMVLCCQCELHVFSGEWQGSCRFFTLLESMDEVSFARCNALDLCWTLDWPAERKKCFCLPSIDFATADCWLALSLQVHTWFFMSRPQVLQTPVFEKRKLEDGTWYNAY